MVEFLNQKDAQALDVDLLSEESGFCVEQLMELAGLSVASSIADYYPLGEGASKKVLVACGPGSTCHPLSLELVLDLASFLL
jgi:NAD(P)H-hydrate epimerase